MPINLSKPKGWRNGQTLFNFFEWLRTAKGFAPNQSSRMADPFHISDKEFDDLYSEFIDLMKS